MKAVLLLEDGTIFEGRSFGAKGWRCGEVVFNTSMTGYQEILTDPSYNEQIITMTYPLIGNYGTNKGDTESRKIFAAGFIVRENCDYPSNWRSENLLGDYLKKNNIVGLEGIDTRMLVKHIRTEGAMRGIISSAELGIAKLKKKLDDYPGLVGRDIVKDVTIKKSYAWDRGVIDMFSGRQKRHKSFTRLSPLISASSKTYFGCSVRMDAMFALCRLILQPMMSCRENLTAYF